MSKIVNYARIIDLKQSLLLFSECRKLNPDIDAISRFIEHGANINEKDNFGWTPLHCVCHNGHEQTAKLLIEHGANIDEKDNSGLTPLHQACYWGHEQIAKLLKEHGAKIDEKDNFGWTSLYSACFKGQEQIAKLLIELGAKIDEKDNSGGTPLHWACGNGHKQIVKLLIEHGAHGDMALLNILIEAQDVKKLEKIIKQPDASAERQNITLHTKANKVVFFRGMLEGGLSFEFDPPLPDYLGVNFELGGEHRELLTGIELILK
ncbi:MAG: ankyrin repeat domain-containing protein [Rickettsiaceae bacterium]|nr:ankyrin repeat domain-containing protein [Rickettsiaceae bacterium]